MLQFCEYKQDNTYTYIYSILVIKKTQQSCISLLAKPNHMQKHNDTRNEFRCIKKRFAHNWQQISRLNSTSKSIFIIYQVTFQWQAQLTTNINCNIIFVDLFVASEHTLHNMWICISKKTQELFIYLEAIMYKFACETKPYAEAQR